MDNSSLNIVIGVALAALFLLGLIYALLRLAWAASIIAAVNAIGIIGIVLMGYTGGSVGRLIGLGILTIAIAPIGLLAAFVIGLDEYSHATH